MLRKFFALFFFLLISFNMYSKEKEIQTNYFRIIYDNTLGEYANELATVADSIAVKEFDFYRLPVPSDYKIDVIIADSKIENAFATPIFTTIYLYPNTPRNKVIEKNYSSWVKYVFTHELSHAILNIKIAGMSFFGRSTLFTIIPFWLHEGLAVYMESKLSDGGRKYSNKFNIFVKLELLENNFKGLSLAGNNQLGKGNAYAYTYGFSFIDFYSSKYGENKLRDAIDHFINPRNAYYSYLTIFANNVNKTTTQLVEEWQAWLRKNIKIPTNLKEGRTLSLPKGLKTHLITKGNKLYFYNSSNKELKVYEYALDTKEYSYLRKINSPLYNFDVYRDKVYYCSVAPNYLKDSNIFMPYIESFAYSNGNKLNLESPINILKIDEDKLVYVSLEYGKQALKFGNNEVIIPFEAGYNFGKLFYYENKLFFDASKNNQKHSYIYEYNFTTKNIKRLVKGEEPFVDNNYIYFVEDAAGINNIFRFDRNNSEIEQLTNVKINASDPIHIDKKLYYINALSSDNFEIKYLEERDFLGKKIEKDPLKVITYKTKPNVLFQEEPYRKKFDFIFFPSFNTYSEKNSFYTEANLTVPLLDDLRKNIFMLNVGAKMRYLSENDSTIFPRLALSYNYLQVFSAKIGYGKSSFNLVGKLDIGEMPEGEWNSEISLNLPFYLSSISSYLVNSLYLYYAFKGSIRASLSEILQKDNLAAGFAAYPELLDFYNKKEFDFKLEVFFLSKYLDITYRFSPYRYLISPLVVNEGNNKVNFPDEKTFVLIPKFGHEFDILKGTEGGFAALKSITLNLRSYVPLSYHENIEGLYNFIINPEVKINTFLWYILPVSFTAGLNIPLYESDQYKADQSGKFKIGEEKIKDSFYYFSFGLHTN